jgi:phage protein U
VVQREEVGVLDEAVVLAVLLPGPSELGGNPALDGLAHVSGKKEKCILIHKKCNYKSTKKIGKMCK